MNNSSSFRHGYTLPVFACASAIAALRHLRGEAFTATVPVDLLEPSEIVNIPIEQVASLSSVSSLGITRSDPGDNLDLTRHTPVWAIVHSGSGGEKITIEGGEGIGVQGGKAAIYKYAQRLLIHNLGPLLHGDETIKVTIIMPFGKQLAGRTSNEAFGVLEGLSLLGTSGIAQPLSAPGQLQAFQEELAHKSKQSDCLVFCVGENGLDLAQKMGMDSEILVKTANWLGSMLVAASLNGVRELLLFGYHGKLIKLAGGIFHTHHHLADGRLEILAAYGVKVGLDTSYGQELLKSATTESALHYLRELDHLTGSNWVEQIYSSLCQSIDVRSQEYVYNQVEQHLSIGSLLFDRSRQIISISDNGKKLLKKLQIFAN
ncbi:MAG: Cobalt-precorrin-5B C(1)-methyltransferase [Chroococcopsis gigantea SAG 12.99]|jgi:cobalt-precorrin-5B (C1)-methyltransferase|nr:Cobalt-precorrin-5B C(1)-methyltransferase [Chroococcopsis gigantea SAG 12.99]